MKLQTHLKQKLILIYELKKKSNLMEALNPLRKGRKKSKRKFCAANGVALAYQVRRSTYIFPADGAALRSQWGWESGIYRRLGHGVYLFRIGARRGCSPWPSPNRPDDDHPRVHSKENRWCKLSKLQVTFWIRQCLYKPWFIRYLGDFRSEVHFSKSLLKGQRLITFSPFS